MDLIDLARARIGHVLWIGGARQKAHAHSKHLRPTAPMVADLGSQGVQVPRVAPGSIPFGPDVRWCQSTLGYCCLHSTLNACLMNGVELCDSKRELWMQLLTPRCDLKMVVSLLSNVSPYMGYFKRLSPSKLGMSPTNWILSCTVGVFSF